MSTEKSLLLSHDNQETRKNVFKTIERKISRPKSPPLVFCIHGNKWGIATCCEELEEHREGKHELMSGFEFGSKDPIHCHQDRQEGIDKKARNKLLFASVLCLVFMIGEIVGGVLSNSLAIATDAAHLLTDFASFMISLFAIWMAAKPKSQRMSFGWHRAEVLGAITSVLMIWVVTGILVYMAVLRVIYQEFEIDSIAMLVTSAFGVGVNIIMGASLHQHGHSHGGGGKGQSHGSGEEGHAHSQKEKENINVKAAFIHVIGDFLQSLGVFIAAVVIYFKPTWVIIDPICTFVFSILVLGTTISILRNTIGVLMEATPSDVSYDIVKETFLSVDGIKQIHNLRIWGLTTDKTALAAHLAVEQGYEAEQVLQEATSKIRARYSFYEMTLQVEHFQADMKDCTQCQHPSG